jgi:predicted nucleotidyltransferase
MLRRTISMFSADKEVEYRSWSPLRATLAAMPALNDSEHECLRRYCGLLHKRLGPGLIAVRMFGSAARGEMWPATSPMHSDIDLLAITREELPQAEQEELLNETYPLYLACGRQLSPHFFFRAARRRARERANPGLPRVDRS